MRYLAILASIIFFWADATAQDNRYDGVPLSVLSAFDKIFPGVKVKTWEREKYGLYEAEFLLEGRNASATFNANGLLMRTEKRRLTNEMPAEIIKHAKDLYPKYKIEECAEITTPDDKLMYEVEISLGKDRKSLIFNKNNDYLREEVDENDDSVKKKSSP